MTDTYKVWDGVFASFSEAAGDGTVFDQEVWLGKMRERAQAALAASVDPASIAPVAESHDSYLPVAAALAARPGETLRILDFGGGLAASYIPLVRMLPPDQKLEFVIVESEGVCRLGREMFADDARVSFRTDMPDEGTRFDIVHCGSSIHYVDDWQGLIARFATSRPDLMLFVDVPAADNASFVTAQNYYGSRIPVRFWKLDEFVAPVTALGYDLTLKARYRGAFLGEKRAPPTDNFDPGHRLQYFSQLLFRRAAPSEKAET